jgi:single-strand DNA-binding protein
VRLGLFIKEMHMAFVRVEQRNAHLAGPVRLEFVNGRDGKVAKATFIAISNTRRRVGDEREDEATSIFWTLWGKPAEAAEEYLGKGSHVNVVGRVQNNNYDKDGETVYTMAFTAEEIDYLDSKAESEALRARQGEGPDEGQAAGQTKPAAASAGGDQGAGAGKGRKTTAKAAQPKREAHSDDIPF